MGLEDFIKSLKKHFGDRVLDDEERLRTYSRDWWPLLMLSERLGEWLRPPPAVVFPESAEEVALIVREARNHGACVLPRGGGSSVTGASISERCVIVSLSRMSKILEFNEEDLYVTAEAGMLLFELEGWLNRRGYTLRHVPQSFHIASIGGAIATASSGQYSTGYGNIEDMLLDLEIVVPDGRILRLRRPISPRSSMGPRLLSLYVGSEALFGIITKATLRILPMPPHRLGNSLVFPDFVSGLKYARELMIRGPRPQLMRLSDEAETSIRFGLGGALMLLEFEGYDDDLVVTSWEKAMAHAVHHGAREMGEEPLERWKKARFEYINDIEMLDSLGLWFETIDVASTWSRLPQVHRAVSDAISASGATSLCHASHFYLNGASLYFTAIFRKDVNEYKRVVKSALIAAEGAGATLSHHHGVGELRRGMILRDPGEAAELLQRLKDAVDPDNVIESKLSLRSNAKYEW